MSRMEKQPSFFLNTIKVMVVLGFAIILGILINYFHTEENDTTEQAFTQKVNTFKNHVSTAHWQWKVQQPTSMIMLVHYNKAGKETNRKPVRMNHNGWPAADHSDEGCEKVWTSLVAAPLMIDGFRVHSRFYTIESENNDSKSDNIRYGCRYSLSSGAFFEYFPETGNTSELVW